MPSSRIEYCASACHITFVTHLLHAHHSPHALWGSRIQADGRKLLSSTEQYRHPHCNRMHKFAHTHAGSLSSCPTKTQLMMYGKDMHKCMCCVAPRSAPARCFFYQDKCTQHKHLWQVWTIVDLHDTCVALAFLEIKTRSGCMCYDVPAHHTQARTRGSKRQRQFIHFKSQTECCERRGERITRRITHTNRNLFLLVKHSEKGKVSLLRDKRRGRGGRNPPIGFLGSGLKLIPST